MDHENLPAVASAQLPQTYQAAKTALAECVRLDECKDWTDKALALASYARQAQDDQMMKMARRIQARAARRAGELLEQIEPASQANLVQNRKDGAVPSVTRESAATEAGMSERQRKTALRLANVPEEQFGELVESDNPPTVTALAEMGKKKRNIVDLGGRDPHAFNKALHFTAAVERYAAEIAKHDMQLMSGWMNEDQRKRARAAIEKIDAAHDSLVTRI